MNNFRLALTLALILAFLPPVPPAPAAPTAPDQTFVCFGDSRSNGDTDQGGVNLAVLTKIAALAAATRPAVALFVGDPFVGSKEMGGFQRQAALFAKAMQPIAAACPVHYTYGNHESRTQEQIDWLAKNFAAAGQQPGYQGIAYSFDVGRNHFVSIATMLIPEVNRVSSGQLAWLEKDLAAHADAAHVFVFGHSPAFPAGPHVHSALDKYPAERDAFWALLGKYRVDAYFCGHEHLYNSREAGGVRQLITGSCGAPLAKGFGGDFFHFAKIECTGPDVAVTVYDESGKVRDTLAWKRPVTVSRRGGPLEVHPLSETPRFATAGGNSYQAAYRAFHAGRYEEAVGRFHALLDLNPNAPTREGALSCLAVSCEKTGNGEMAVGIYEHLVAEFPQSGSLATWYAKLGRLCGEDDEWDEAAGWYERAARAEANPSGGGADLLKAGLAHERDGRPAEAIRCYRDVTANGPGTTPAVRAAARLAALGAQ